MQTRIYLVFFLLFNICICHSQMVKTSHGPNIYINPVIVKEKKIKNLSFVEYTISSGKKTMIDKSDISFDTTGKPSAKSIPNSFRKPDIYDTVTYDQNRNIVQVKSNKNFEYVYKYDNKNRETYFFAIDHTAQGPHFSVTNYQYDKNSRITLSDTREGKGTDTTKVDSRYILTYTYDNVKLLNVKEKKLIRNKNGGESEAFETTYLFEYNQGVPKRVYANSTLNSLDIVISQENKNQQSQ